MGIKLEEGTTVLTNQGHCEIVGIRLEGYDLIRYTDHKVMRNVPRSDLTPLPYMV